MDVKKIGTIAYYGFLGALVLIAALMAISIFPISGYEIRVVRSGSMEPTIHTGSVVVVAKSGDYKIGDVITFNGGFLGPDGELVPVTHRIVEMRVARGVPLYTTKGDANEDPDGREVRDNQVLGKVLFSIPYVGYAVEAARRPSGFLALVIVPSLIIFYDQGRSVWREFQKMRARKV